MTICMVAAGAAGAADVDVAGHTHLVLWELGMETTSWPFLELLSVVVQRAEYVGGRRLMSLDLKIESARLGYLNVDWGLGEDETEMIS